MTASLAPCISNAIRSVLNSCSAYDPSCTSDMHRALVIAFVIDHDSKLPERLERVRSTARNAVVTGLVCCESIVKRKLDSAECAVGLSKSNEVT